MVQLLKFKIFKGTWLFKAERIIYCGIYYTILWYYIVVFINLYRAEVKCMITTLQRLREVKRKYTIRSVLFYI